MEKLEKRLIDSSVVCGFNVDNEPSHRTKSVNNFLDIFYCNDSRDCLHKHYAHGMRYCKYNLKQNGK